MLASMVMIMSYKTLMVFSTGRNIKLLLASSVQGSNWDEKSLRKINGYMRVN